MGVGGGGGGGGIVFLAKDYRELFARHLVPRGRKLALPMVSGKEANKKVEQRRTSQVGGLNERLS